MRSTIKWGRGGLVALVAGAAAALAVPAMGKNLYIDFSDREDRICYGECGAEGSLVQKLTTVSNSNCEMLIDGDRVINHGETDDLINFTFTGGAAIGFDAGKNFIGLKQISGGTPCGRLGAPNQTLTLALGTEIPAGAGVYRATLSFDNRSDVRIDINTNGGAMGTNYTVLAGKFRTGAPSTGPLLPGETFNCPNTRACLVDLRGPVWTSITFGAPEGVSGNAGDWALGGANNIELFLADGELACGETVDIVPGALILTRLPNVCPTEVLDTCPVKIPYAATFGGDTLDFFADYSVLEECSDGTPVEPAFKWTVTGDPISLPINDADFPDNGAPRTPTELAAKLLLSTQYFDNPDLVYNVDACIGSIDYRRVYDNNILVVDENDEPILGLVLNLLPELDEHGAPIISVDDPLAAYRRYDMSPTLGGIQYGCFLERNVQVLELDKCAESDDAICVQTEEVIYLRGDWTWAQGTTTTSTPVR